MESESASAKARARWINSINARPDAEWERIVKETGIDDYEFVSPSQRAQAMADEWKRRNLEAPRAAEMRRQQLSAAGQLGPPGRPRKQRHPLLWMRARYYGLAVISGAVSGFVTAWLYSSHG